MKRNQYLLVLVILVWTFKALAQTGTLHLSADVPEVKFYLGNKVIGEYQDGAVVIEGFPVGWHTITAKKQNFPSQLKVIKVEEGGDYYLSFVFEQGKPFEKPKEEEKPDQAPDYRLAEKQPELVGGEKALYDYIAENNLYPEKAKSASKSGLAIISFIVGTDGIPYNLLIVQEEPEGFGFGKAAFQALANMEFTPAELKGKPIPVNMQQVVKFQIK